MLIGLGNGVLLPMLVMFLVIFFIYSGKLLCLVSFPFLCGCGPYNLWCVHSASPFLLTPCMFRAHPGTSQVFGTCHRHATDRAHRPCSLQAGPLKRGNPCTKTEGTAHFFVFSNKINRSIYSSFMEYISRHII